MSNGISGFGTTLSGAVSGVIVEITRIGIDGMDVPELDVTTMASTSGWREFIAGLKDAGALTLDLLYEKSQFSTMLGILGGTVEAWTITLPDSSTFVVDGFLKGLGAEIPMDDKILSSASLKLSGVPEFTASSG